MSLSESRQSQLIDTTSKITIIEFSLAPLYHHITSIQGVVYFHCLSYQQKVRCSSVLYYWKTRHCSRSCRVLALSCIDGQCSFSETYVMFSHIALYMGSLKCFVFTLCFTQMTEYKYQNGWGNHFSTEAIAGALPLGQNSPQQPAFGLYTEQLSGTAFTVSRKHNERSWLYRIRPSVGHKKYHVTLRLLCFIVHLFTCTFQPHATIKKLGVEFDHATIEQLRWKPFALPAATERKDFVAGLNAIAGAGDPSSKSGICIYNYGCNASMKDSAFCNSDGDFLIVPQQGALDIVTEFGRLLVGPCEIVVIQVV
jgi:hypothetical protein